MIFDYKAGDVLLAAGLFLVGLRMLLGFDHLNPGSRKLLVGFCVGVATALLFIGTISRDNGTPTVPEALSPLSGHALRAYRTKKRKKFGSRTERKAASLLKKRMRSEKKAARKLKRIAKSERSKGRIRQQSVMELQFAAYTRSEQTSVDQERANNARRVKAIQTGMLQKSTNGRFRSPYKKGDTPLGPTPGGTTSPGGVRAGIGGKAKRVGLAAAAFGAGIVAEQGVSMALDYMYSKLPKGMSPYNQSFSKAQQREGVGVYYKNQLLGQMSRESYKLLRRTARRAVQNQLRAM